MKKLVTVVIVVAMLFGTIAGLPRNVKAQKEMFLTLVVGVNQYILNGVQETMDSPAVIVNSRTFVPIRLVAETFGADVGWDAATKTVSIKLDQTEIKLKIGSLTATVNGK
ncbi:MAG: copper amine oxidase N-terminal domain-containing protein, partial [Caldisericaceae bacterium]